MQKPIVQIDARSQILKCDQIVEGIIGAIRDGRLSLGDPLPSINDLLNTQALSRETVIKAYRLLKQRGVVEAIPRKGYFVATTNLTHKIRVFLMFDEFSPYKEVLYNAIFEKTGTRASLDIYFHNYNFEVFEKLVADHAGRHDLYVMMPHPGAGTAAVLDQLPRDQVFILDRKVGVTNRYAHLCQDFGDAVQTCLVEAAERIRTYRRFVLVFPRPSHHPPEITRGFRRFCKKQGIECRVIHGIEGIAFPPGQAWFVIDDKHLVWVVEQARKHGYELGRDVGLLSYNDTPMKKIIGDGISTISTDFEAMGRRTAQYILDRQPLMETHPTQLILRRSL